jgi:hypothetical protein
LEDLRWTLIRCAISIALGVVAALAVGLVVANRDDSPPAVVPANELAAEQSAAGEAIISSTVASVLPEGFKVSAVEHSQEQQLNITAASPNGVVLFIKAILTSSGAVVSDTEPQGTGSVAELTVPVPTMAPGSVRHQTVLTNQGDTIQNIADALSVSVGQLSDLYIWPADYIFDSSVYVGWVDTSTISDVCLIAPCLRYLSDKITVESVATELGIAPQALAAYNGFGLDHPVASNFPIVLPTIEETMSMTGATVGDVSDSTVPSPAVVGIAQDKDLSVTIERFALDGQSLDDSLTQKVHDALLSLNTPDQTLQTIVDSIILIPTQPGFASIEEGATFRSLGLTQATSYADGSFSYVTFTASDGSSAMGMIIRLPATAIADSVITDDNGVIVAIHSNETTTCIVWLVDAQSIGATEVEVAALASEELDYSPSAPSEIPVFTEAPVDTFAPVNTAVPATTYPPSTDAPVDTLAVITTSTIEN